MIIGMKKIILISLFIMSANLFFKTAAAAPHPAAGSSMISQIKSGLALSMFGVELKQLPPHWLYLESIEEKQTMIIGSQSQIDQAKAQLTFKYEDFKNDFNLEAYVKKYMRDYNQYGFDIIGSQSIITKMGPTVILDLKQKNLKSKARQVFYKNKKRLLSATCISDIDNYETTLAYCNQTLGSMNWKLNEK